MHDQQHTGDTHENDREQCPRSYGFDNGILLVVTGHATK